MFGMMRVLSMYTHISARGQWSMSLNVGKASLQNWIQSSVKGVIVSDPIMSRVHAMR